MKTQGTEQMADNDISMTSQKFQDRAAAARAPTLIPDLFSKPAQDYIRILTFAGFDPQKIMMAAYRRTNRRETWKINLPTIEKAWDDCYYRDSKTNEYIER